ncbi:MAG: ADP-forming succinate--CoA ligase subunit beta [Candidatus Abyssobacteria bacterium SURF_17]|uniref:Succinate--CoA ligase [ADP-forming] subunit beta n=1 Tax=Candidatus Abyssobacteria bacterium SURF_17 TaxID=2093361 RepID=A0A419EUF9_9BACT|nr:MAG: ADP-forming succinate--CoA ligase subunit beta [Candidatus Abyssubacteria bacterium SURF_17]
MKIHEYQAKELLKKFGVAVPRGRVAERPEDARAIAEELGGPVVVKAQIHAGGRGKGGGIKLANSPAEAEQAARAIIGMRLVTHQTGPEGRIVKRVLVEEAGKISRELYLGMVIDRVSESPVIMASEAGGMEIEEVAAKSPEKILKVTIDPAVGLQPFQIRKLCYGLNLAKELSGKVGRMISGLYKAFMECDCSLAEINPLAVTEQGEAFALDAKMNLDDNALYRHEDLKALRDLAEEEALEVEASKHNLSYIKLDGSVGCMVNGAGLAMATMDIIKLHGQMPANFLDVGGAASSERVANAFRILTSDKNVRAVLINIFGGIVRCDRVANGIVEALKEVEVKVPIVVRLEGTNAVEARDILQKSGLQFTVADTFDDAARKAVAAIR